MSIFESLYAEYENTNNVCEFCNKYKSDRIATRFLLVRSLDKNNLREILEKLKITQNSNNIRDLGKSVYESDITISQLLDYIESKRDDLIKERESELDGISNILSKIPVVNCGVRNDKVDDIVKGFVRNKSIKEYEDLVKELDNNVLKKVRQYCLWSYYNQNSNDIIELAFLKHKKVIPTLRKIHDIDFFIRLEDDLIPFDLKYTHISDSYFDLASQGIDETAPTIFDDYTIDCAVDSELKKIRAYYNEYKRNHRELGLIAASKLTKAELIDFIERIGDRSSSDFIQKAKDNRSKYVPKTPDQLKTLEWWNYKYQGERLFCNNNRLFVFLAYNDQFVDGRELKGKTTEIEKKISELLNKISKGSIHQIHYHYDKEAGLIGDYTALSTSTIYYE